MNWRAFGAIFRREIHRGRRQLALLMAVGAGAVICALTLSPGGEALMIVSSLSIIPAIIAVFGAPADLRTDKTQGYIEFDRVLPISHRAMATARLAGAGIRTTPILLLVAPIFIALFRQRQFSAPTFTALVVFVPGAAWVFLTVLMWLLMAVNIRWNLRRLWWLPMTIGFSPTILRSILPTSWKRAIQLAVQGYFDRHGDALSAFASSAAGIATFSAILLVVPLLVLFGTVSLFASGIERYNYDASAAVPMQAKPPKRELAAIGRGPSLAVARYCVRLATEQSWRRFLLLGVFVVVLLFGSGELKNYARFYVRALAALIPGGIALQLSMARARGHLEGIQQLPHPAIKIAVGYLLAITVLSAPGAAVWVLARSVTGMPVTVANTVSLWAWMVAWSWIACVMMLWLTTKRMLMIGAIPTIALITWAAYVGRTHLIERGKVDFAAFADFRATAGPTFPMLIAGMLLLGGLPLFARGLAEYEFSSVGKTGMLLRAFNRRASRSPLR